MSLHTEINKLIEFELFPWSIAVVPVMNNKFKSPTMIIPAMAYQ